jgi:hypothetical protein
MSGFDQSRDRALSEPRLVARPLGSGLPIVRDCIYETPRIIRLPAARSLWLKWPLAS